MKKRGLFISLLISTAILLGACTKEEPIEVDYEIAVATKHVSTDQYDYRLITDAVTEEEFLQIEKDLREELKSENHDSIFIYIHDKPIDDRPFGEYKATIRMAFNSTGRWQLGFDEKDFDLEMEQIPTSVETAPAENTTKSTKTFEEYSEGLKGSLYMKDVFVKDLAGTIEYYSYEEFKKAYPDTTETEESFQYYFGTGNYVEKIMVGEPLRLLREFPELDSIKMILPFDGAIYKINLTRKEANAYLDLKIEETSVTDYSWESKIVDGYIYHAENRKRFFNHFVQIS